MSKFLDLGLGISLINVYYSLSYFLMWCVELQHDFEDDNETFIWMTVYMCNLLLNVFLFLGLRKRDRLAIVVWFSLTLLWFLPKLYGHSGVSRLDRRGSMYQIVNVVMEIYVIISFVVMLLVYIYLPQRRKRSLARRSLGKANNVDSLDLQMVDLTDKAASSNVNANAELKPSGDVGQKVSTFEFHQPEESTSHDD